MSLAPAIVMVAIFSFILYYAIPSIIYNGWHFFTSYQWNPGISDRPPWVVNGITAPYEASFGWLLFQLVTELTSVLALIIAIPVSLAVSLAIELYTPEKTKKPLICFVELFYFILMVFFCLLGIIDLWLFF